MSWVQKSGGQRYHKVIQARAGSLRPLEPPEAYLHVPGAYPAAAGATIPAN